MGGIIKVRSGGVSEYEEKRSVFIAQVYPVNSEQEANAYIEAARKKYWDARHNCYAFVIGDNNECSRCSDDKEPAGTAGKPILEVINGMSVHNCLVIVTRYFGGTLLGTGGLVRAYTRAAKDAMCNSSLVEEVLGVQYLITTDYNGMGRIRSMEEEYGFCVVNTEYSDVVEMTVNMEAADAEKICAAITDNTNGRARIERLRDLPIEKAYESD